MRFAIYNPSYEILVKFWFSRRIIQVAILQLFINDIFANIAMFVIYNKQIDNFLAEPIQFN